MTRVSLADQLRLGPTAAAVKAKVGHKRWKQLVSAAHKGGYAVDSFLDPNTPGPLKQRTSAFLRDQATKTISAAYAPAEADLTNQESRIKAISDKRALDNQYYSDWLRTRSAELAAHSEAADTALQNAQANIAQQGLAATNAAQQDINNAVAAHGNIVSNPAEAKAANVAPEVARNAGLYGAQQTADATAAHSNSVLRDFGQASDFALMAASEAKRVADTWDKLQSVATDRQKLQLQKGSDLAKEISRLLDGEVSKAQQNQQTQAAEAQLGIKQKQLNLDSFKAHAAAKTAAGTLSNKQARLNFDKLNASITQGFQQSKINIDQGKLNLGWYKAKHPGAGSGKPGTGSKSKHPQDRFDFGYALIATQTVPVYNKKTKGYDNRPIKTKDVAKQEDVFISKLVREGISRKMAHAIVNAYITIGGGDPGNYAGWLDRPAPKPQHHGGPAGP